MAKYADTCKKSMELNSAFDDSIYSEVARQFKYNTNLICEVFCPGLKKVGSSAEGTDFSDSDLDFLLIEHKGVKVGYDQQEADSGKQYLPYYPYLRLTRGPLTPAGYTKLQIYLNGINCEIIENIILPTFFKHEFKRYNSNTIFLTNHKLIDKFHQRNVTEHGPAQTIQMNNNEIIDNVIAYESNIIPIDMNSWFERTRLNNWPSKTTCELFKSMGCFYVAVGHSKSPEQDIEWRISPTRQELHLMSYLNPTQFRCYILLKLIKKFMNDICGDGITSYHCKTALFWTLENTEHNIWQPQNLIECVLKCLKLLLVWVTENNCPNYFIPKENMFETKVINEIQLNTLQIVITRYIEVCSVVLPEIKNHYQKNGRHYQIRIIIE